MGQSVQVVAEHRRGLPGGGRAGTVGEAHRLCWGTAGRRAGEASLLAANEVGEECGPGRRSVAILWRAVGTSAGDFMWGMTCKGSLWDCGCRVEAGFKGRVCV